MTAKKPFHLTDTHLTILGIAARRADRMVLPVATTLKARGAALERALKGLVARGLIEECLARRDEQQWRLGDDGHRLTLKITGPGLVAIGIEDGLPADPAITPAVVEVEQPAGDARPGTAARTKGFAGGLAARLFGKSFRDLYDAAAMQVAAQPGAASSASPTGAKQNSAGGGNARRTAKRRPVAESEQDAGRHGPGGGKILRPGTKGARVLELLRDGNGATIDEMMQSTGWQAHSVRGFLAGTVKNKLQLDLLSKRDTDGERRYRIAG